MVRKLQHEMFGLTDEEAAKVFLEFARRSIEEKTGWDIVEKTEMVDRQRDFLMFLLGLDVGFISAKLNFCGENPCCQCVSRDQCNVALESRFLGQIRSIYKHEGSEKVIEFIMITISKRRREVWEEEQRGYG